MVEHKEKVIAGYVLYKSARQTNRYCCVTRIDLFWYILKYGIHRGTTDCLAYSSSYFFDVSNGLRFVCDRSKVDHGICSLGIHDPAEKNDENHFKVHSAILHVLSGIHRIWKVRCWIAIMVET